MGVLTLLLASWHNDRTRRMIDGDIYQAATHLIFAFIAIVFGLGLASVVYLLTILR